MEHIVDPLNFNAHSFGSQFVQQKVVKVSATVFRMSLFLLSQSLHLTIAVSSCRIFTLHRSFERGLETLCTQHGFQAEASRNPPTLHATAGGRSH